MPELKLSDKQREYIQSPFIPDTLEMNEGSVRAGKSIAITLRYYLYLNKTTDPNHAIFAVNSSQAIRIFIDGNGFGLQYLFPDSQLRRDKYGTHLSFTSLTGPKKLYIFGIADANSEKPFTGITLGSFILSEVNLLNQNAVNECFRRTFASPNRLAIADMNPPSPHHWVVEELMPSQNVIYRHWTLYDNPIMTPERIESIKNILIKNETLYKRDFLGQRVMANGLVFQIFDHSKHTLKSIAENEEIIDQIFSVDGGIEHPSVLSSLIITRVYKLDPITKTRKYKYKVYLTSQLTISDHSPFSKQAISMKKWIEDKINKYNKGSLEVYYDPACPAIGLELQQNGISSYKANNGNKGKKLGVKGYLELIQSLLIENELIILDNDETQNLFKEFSSYSYDDKSGEPIKFHDDHCDSLRYGIAEYLSRYSNRI